MLKNKILIAIISSLLMLSAVAVEESETGVISQTSSSEVQVVDTEQNAQNSLENLNVQSEQEEFAKETDDLYKEPISKRKIAKKFLMAMSGVVLSSLIIYTGLTVYNKLRDGFVSAQIINDKDEKPLDVPENLTEAVKSFLDKTHWEG